MRFYYVFAIHGMAWESGNAELSRKNSKLESFLKRTLTNEAFESVRSYESCIVVSENENKAFKYVILTDQRLYLTENPPKVLQETVHFRDLVSVELVNEYPDFLSGEERVRTQQIAVTYLTSEPRRRSFRGVRRSPRGSQGELSEIRSNASTPVSLISSLDGTLSEDLNSLTRSTESLHRSASWGSGQKPNMGKKKKKVLGLNDILEQGTILRSLQEEMEEDILDDHSSRLSAIKSARSSLAPLSPSPRINPVTLKDRKQEINMYNKEKLWLRNSPSPLPPLHGVRASHSRSELHSYVGTPARKEVDVVNIKGCCSFFLRPHRVKSQVSPEKEPKLPKLQLMVNGQQTNAIPIIQTEHFVTTGAPKRPDSLGSRTSLLRDNKLASLGTDGDNSLSSMSDLGRLPSIRDSSVSVTGWTEKRKTVLNIFILNLESAFLFYLTSAWNSYLIRSMLALQPEMLQKSAEHNSTNKENPQLMFGQLERSILKPGQSLADLTLVVDQLYSAAKSHGIFKKLFWKNTDMLAFLIGQLKKYLPKSSAALDTHEGKVQRADEIKFTILVLSIINFMLRESETISGCQQVLKLEGGRLVADLLSVLIFQPEFPAPATNLAKFWTAPAMHILDQQTACTVDEELARLKMDYFQMSISSLFELFQVGKWTPVSTKTSWQLFHKEADVLTVAGMVAMFVQKKAAEKFLDFLMSHLMSVVTPSKFELLHPLQMLHVFQMFSVLLTFLQYSRPLVSFVHNKFYEEFKYFIQAPAVSRRLPPYYPVTPATLALMEQVVSKVLGAK